MALSINITKRDRKRTLKNGECIVHTRYVVNYRDPRTGERKQLFFERQKDAVAKRNELLTAIQSGVYCDERKMPTIAEAVDQWLANRENEIKA
jgi:integrase